MMHISELIRETDDALESARKYAERYITLKAEGESWSDRFKQMSLESLAQAISIHQYAEEEVTALQIEPPPRMKRVWEMASAEYRENVAWLEKILER